MNGFSERGTIRTCNSGVQIDFLDRTEREAIEKNRERWTGKVARSEFENDFEE